MVLSQCEYAPGVRASTKNSARVRTCRWRWKRGLKPKKSRRVACSLEPWHVWITCGSVWFKYFSLNEQWEGGQPGKPGPSQNNHRRNQGTTEQRQRAKKSAEAKLQLARRIQASSSGVVDPTTSSVTKQTKFLFFLFCFPLTTTTN